MDEIKVININGALNVFAKYLESIKQKWLITHDINKGRHKLIIAHDGEKQIKYYLLFKREFFLSADKQFNTKEGFFESLNEEWLDFAIAKKVDQIIYVYPNSFVYGIYPMQIKKYVEIHNTKRISESEDKRIINNQVKTVNEVIVSFSLDLLKRLNKGE